MSAHASNHREERAVHSIRWKKQLGDISTSELKELRQLREENRKLKQLVADLSLGDKGGQ